jgi:hypothetical protein
MAITVVNYANLTIRPPPARPPVSATAFIAALVRALAWPGVAVAILIIFRHQFGTILERLARLRIGSGSGAPDADPDWDQTESSVRQSLLVPRPALTAAPPGRHGPPGAAERSPQALVEDHWLALTAELRDVVLRSGSVSDVHLTGADFDQLMEAALRAGLLDTAAVRALDGLRHLHNQARTSPDLSERRAEAFAVMADAVSYSMRRDHRPAAWPTA